MKCGYYKTSTGNVFVAETGLHNMLLTTTIHPLPLPLSLKDSGSHLPSMSPAAMVVKSIGSLMIL